MRQQFNLDVMDVHGKDLTTNLMVIINKMCDFFASVLFKQFTTSIQSVGRYLVVNQKHITKWHGRMSSFQKLGKTF